MQHPVHETLKGGWGSTTSMRVSRIGRFFSLTLVTMISAYNPLSNPVLGNCICAPIHSDQLMLDSSLTLISNMEAWGTSCSAKIWLGTNHSSLFFIRHLSFFSRNWRRHWTWYKQINSISLLPCILGPQRDRSYVSQSYSFGFTAVTAICIKWKNIFWISKTKKLYSLLYCWGTWNSFFYITRYG